MSDHGSKAPPVTPAPDTCCVTIKTLARLIGKDHPARLDPASAIAAAGGFASAARAG